MLRTRMVDLGLLDPDPLVGGTDPSIIKQKWLPSNSNKQKISKKLVLFSHLQGQGRKYIFRIL
jgi:hypothetical protein